MLLNSDETWQFERDAVADGTLSLLPQEPVHLRAIIATVIVLNMIVLCLECDHPDWPGWEWLNALFLSFYILEFAARASQEGGVAAMCTGPTRKFMLYDLAVLVIGVVDLIVSVVFAWHNEGAADDGIVDEPALVQVLHITRLLRTYRLVRLHPGFYSFVLLMRRMVGTFAVILSLVFVLCFVLSIIMTQVVGHGMVVSSDDSLAEEARNLFSSVPTTLFTLFQLTTLDNWASIAGPMIRLSVAWRLFFVAFIMLISWTMLSLLTAVASEIMMEGQTEAATEEVILQEARRQHFIVFLCDEFKKVDSDGNGKLNRAEFIDLMTQPTMLSLMAAHGVDLKARDLHGTWNNFDVDDEGELTIDHLEEGFRFLTQDLATKQVASVDYTLKRFTRKIEDLSNQIARDLDDADQKMEAVASRLPMLEASDPVEDTTPPKVAPPQKSEESNDLDNVNDGVFPKDLCRVTC